MTRSTSARLAGFMFLFYIATALPAMVLFDRAATGAGNTERLASIAQHPTSMHWTVVLTFVTFVDAVALAVALYGVTRDEDHELALFALSCRLGEGVINAMGTVLTLGLLSVATTSVAASGAEATSAQALGAFLLRVSDWSTLVSATCFAVGSTVFAYLFLRARSIPMWLAWLGVLGSAVLVVGLLLQMGGVLRGPVTNYMCVPVAIFEVVLGFWLLVKGVAEPRAHQS